MRTFTLEEVTALVNKHGKSAILYTASCAYCNKPFEVRAYTALGQFRKYGSFIPPGQCSTCFQRIRAVTCPAPPGNARLTPQREQCQAATPTNDDNSSSNADVAVVTPPNNTSEMGVIDGMRADSVLRTRLSPYEGKVVELTLSPAAGESPVSGFCVAVSHYGVAIVDVGQDPLWARFYPHRYIITVSLPAEAVDNAREVHQYV